MKSSYVLRMLRFLLPLVVLSLPSVKAESFQKKPPEPLPQDTTPPTLDVNLGESPEDFVAACWAQLSDTVLSPAERKTWAAKLETPAAPRRIDLALLLAEKAGVKPAITYSDPWQRQIDLAGAPLRKVKRQVGAVMMFFFTSPNNPNGSIHWCNNHATGMDQPSEFYGFGSEKAGYYHPHNPGFWFREFKDAEYAGLSFVLLNFYGPEWKPPLLDALNSGLQAAGETVKIGLFDDTWTWGRPYFGDFWKQVPDLARAEEAAGTLYEAKWKPFFTALPKERWFEIGGRPVIYFYNAGTLVPREKTSAVIARMKKLFAADFGVEPYVVVDQAFFADREMPQVADGKFGWFTLDLPGGVFLDQNKDRALANAMVRWDHTARENNNTEIKARPGERLLKDDQRLIEVLNATQNVDYLVLATWNDLGEGTGINRCFDYYWGGRWRTPDHFLQLIRRSQEGWKLTP